MSGERQEKALALYARGNQLFNDSLFAAAVENYRQALGYWEHPGIHYNLMLALVALDDPIEAYQASIEALQYGPTALEQQEYRRTQAHHELLRERIADLTVICDEPGAVVSLDGKNILRGPGKAIVLMLPGQHELVARKPGYLAIHQSIVLRPAKPLTVTLRMLPSAEAMISTQRWASWKPWALVGGGIGIGLLGGTLQWQSNVNNREFQQLFTDNCPSPGGCHEPEYSNEMKTRQWRYLWYRRMGHSLSATGGLITVSGLVLLYLNRTQQLENPARRDLVRMSLAPLAITDASGLSVNIPF